jgi:hypothetical protein
MADVKHFGVTNHHVQKVANPFHVAIHALRATTLHEQVLSRLVQRCCTNRVQSLSRKSTSPPTPSNFFLIEFRTGRNVVRTWQRCSRSPVGGKGTFGPLSEGVEVRGYVLRTDRNNSWFHKTRFTSDNRPFRTGQAHSLDSIARTHQCNLSGYSRGSRRFS